MNILVTGYPGFLASNLLGYLCSEKNLLDDHRWTFCHNRETTYACSNKCDLMNSNDVSDLIDYKKPDVIIHLAASCDMSEPDPIAHYQNNIVMTSNLLNFAPKDCRFVLSSSSTVYGDSQKPYPNFEMSPLYPTSEYGAAKIACESLMYAMQSQKRLSGVALRFPAIVGPNMTHGMLKDLIRKVKSDDPKLYVFGKYPGSEKPFLHSDIAVKALIEFSIGSLSSLNGPFNICPLDNISVLDVCNIVMDRLGVKKEIEFSGNTWAGDNRFVLMHHEKAHKAGFLFDMGSKQAIEKAIGENE